MQLARPTQDGPVDSGQVAPDETSSPEQPPTRAIRWEPWFPVTEDAFSGFSDRCFSVPTFSISPLRSIRERSGKLSERPLKVLRWPQPLNQRVQGSSPCTTTNGINDLDKVTLAFRAFQVTPEVTGRRVLS